MKPLIAGIILISSLAPLTTQAAIQVVENGILVGARNVEVNNIVYDVTFTVGLCSDIYDDCSTSTSGNFSWSDGALAIQALAESILIDTGLGAFDSDPSKAFGCEQITQNYCTFIVLTGAHREFLAFTNRGTNDNSGTAQYADPDPLFGSYEGGHIAAVFTPSATTIPIPAAAWLFASGILGLIGLRRFK